MDIQMPSSISQPEETLSFFKSKMAKVGFAGIALVLLFGILIYFNVKPSRTSQISQPTAKNINISTIKVFCPSAKEVCQNGQDALNDQKQYVGIGYKLASGSAIFAAFDGILSSTVNTFTKKEDDKTTQKKFFKVYLDNADLRLRATYYFRGSISKVGKAAKGEQIAVSNGKRISIYDNNSLIFSLIQGYPTASTPTILNKERFEQQ